jgi:hypothetical protein
MAFSTDDLEAVRHVLKELPVNRPRNVSKRDAVAALASELAAAQRRGYSVDELAAMLSTKGLAITPGTLRGYLRRTRKKRKVSEKATAPRAAAPANERNGDRTQARPAASPHGAALPPPRGSVPSGPGHGSSSR